LFLGSWWLLVVVVKLRILKIVGHDGLPGVVAKWKVRGVIVVQVPEGTADGNVGVHVDGYSLNTRSAERFW
jgi:hypothetical protein